MSRSTGTVVIAVLCVSLTVSHAASGPVSAPGFAPSSGGTSSLGGITQRYPLSSSLNGTSLPDNAILQNVTIRCVGENLANANQTFRTTMEQIAQQIFGENSLQLEIKYRPGVMAPVYGPAGLNGSRAAYAPTPGQVPVDFGRKLLQSQKPFNKETYNDRYTVFMSVDVEILAHGGDDASIVQIKNPSQLMGYLSVMLAQRSMQIQTTPTNMSISSTVLPFAERIPLPTTYVLGTVLQVTGTELAPVNTQLQTMMMQALLGLFGSQSAFLFNRIGAVWSASRPGEDTVRFAIYTYTNSRIGSMNEIAGGDVATLMQQIAQSTGANFTVLVISSEALGTQVEELSGSPHFNLDIATPQALRSVNSSSNLDGKQIAGIVIGSVAGAVIVLGAIAGFLLIQRRRRQQGGEKDGKAPGGDFLHRAILSSSDNSSAIPNSKGSTTQSSQNSPRGTRIHPLSDAWNIDPAELAVCQLPNGKDWMLGSGSFGQVFRGLRGGVQDVAIKQIIKPGDMHVRMFEKEVALLRHLNFDKNLVQFYGACIADDNLMLVLEYMDGGDLKDAIGNDPVGEFGWYRKGGSILKDVARGLHFLHSNRVAHRDLKTKNILLTKSGEAKIADVGLAKLVGSQLLSTQLDTAGTFAYAAPELLLGEACDQSADIYSFGVILWEVITHQIPVRGDLRAIETPKEAPPEVADLIQKCLQRLPRARPSAKEIFEILQSLLATPGATLPPVLESSEARLYSNESVRTELVSDVVPSQLTQPLSLSAQDQEAVASGYTDLRASGVQTSEINTSELHTSETGASTGASTGTNPVASPRARTRPLASA